MKWKILFAAFLIFCASGATEPMVPIDLSGVYEVEGKENDDEYVGMMTLDMVHDNVYCVDAVTGKGIHVKGVAVYKNKILAISWRPVVSSEMFGVSLFEKDGKNWKGNWYLKGGESLNTETLTLLKARAKI